MREHGVVPVPGIPADLRKAKDPDATERPPTSPDDRHRRRKPQPSPERRSAGRARRNRVFLQRTVAQHPIVLVSALWIHGVSFRYQPVEHRQPVGLFCRLLHEPNV